MRLSAMLCLAMMAFPALAVAQGAPAAQTLEARDLILDGPDRVETTPGGRAVPRGYALIVGVSRYRNLDEPRQLKYPESDAEAIYRVLISQEGGAFQSQNVHLLLGAKATLANIRYELEEWLPTVAQPSDRVVVFFAGHGFVKDGRGYLAPWDVDPARLDTTAYPMTRLGEVLGKQVKAGWKVLLTDACHSGKINAETTNEGLDQQFNSLPTNFLTLTATTEREQSYEDANLSTGFGLFTYFLAQAWKGNADNDPCDGVVTADELIEYVRTNVRRYAKDKQVSQTPTARGDYDPRMLVGVGSPCVSNGGPPRESLLGTAVVEVNLDDVDLYIDDELIGRIRKDKPLTIPRLATGIRVFKGVRQGYEPDTKKIMISPGQEVTVTIRIRYPRQNKRSAIDLNDQGEKLLFTKRSSYNPLNAIPVARAQSQADLRKSAEFFERALGDDPGFALAAFRLGQARQLIGDQAGSMEAFRSALKIDPSYVDARIQYAALLIESGDPDGAIRELTDAVRLDPNNDELHAMFARAYWDKSAWVRAVESAEKAIALNPSNSMARLWRGDAQRMRAAEEKAGDRRALLYRDARDEYSAFLKLTNFSSSFGERLAFHFIGSGVGSRKHADREESYRSLRNSGFLGLCITEQKVGNMLRAREYCQRAVPYGRDNPITYFLLGNINRDLYNQYRQCSYIIDASTNYSKMLSLNSELAESKNAKNYLEQIGGILSKLRC